MPILKPEADLSPPGYGASLLPRDAVAEGRRREATLPGPFGRGILVPDVMSAPRLRDLVLVSAGLGLDGGGRALVGRLLAGACADFARRRGVGLRLVSLTGGLPAGVGDPAVPLRDFGGDARALALHLWRQQVLRRREAYVFDLLGPARVEAFLPRPLRSPYLVALHGVEVWHRLEWDRQRALSGATALFAVSEHTLTRARPHCQGLERAQVVPLALEERRPEGIADMALAQRLGRSFVLIAGRMASGERYKGHDQLLEALPHVRKLCPYSRLVVAGDGDDRARLAQKAEALGVGDAVFFTGFTNEATLHELYRRCAVFAMPSRGEGFGLVYLEAMRAARPVLAARGSAAAEVVADGETGLLVDPDDRETLARTLARLLRDAGAARRMGWAGRERWEKQFGMERFRERLTPLLETLVTP